MESFDKIAKLTFQYKNIVIALGTFDGLHKGHQSVISRAVDIARASDGTSVVFTFSNHPLSMLDPLRCPPQLISQEEKEALLADMGVDVFVAIPFNQEFLALSPQKFIELLLTAFAPQHIVVGPNYSFGNKGEGTPELLAEAGRRHGFAVDIQPAVYVDQQLVSSTLIRQMIAQGQVGEAARLLGRPFALTGKVIDGDKRGRTIGFPTANIELEPAFAIPANGVYAVQVWLKGKRYNGVANVGTNPTFHGEEQRLEVHLLDFSGDLYGQVLCTQFVAWLRGEAVFNGIEELKNQIDRDIQAALPYLKENSNKCGA